MGFDPTKYQNFHQKCILCPTKERENVMVHFLLSFLFWQFCPFVCLSPLTWREGMTMQFPFIHWTKSLLCCMFHCWSLPVVEYCAFFPRSRCQLSVLAFNPFSSTLSTQQSLLLNGIITAKKGCLSMAYLRVSCCCQGRQTIGGLTW